MQKGSRRQASVVAAAVAVVVLAAGLLWNGCMEKNTKKKEDAISVYLWSADLMVEYAPYIQAQLPDIEIQFVVGNNDLDFYRFMKENGALPDIITNRRFSLYDSERLKNQLLDLSYTQEVASFYQAYLDNYTNSDGTINWLPLCGEVDGFIANKKLFDQFDIALPTDYDTFVEACHAFEKVGIRGFAADFSYDYTCLELLQGLSIPELMSMEGQFWRHQYEDTTSEINGLDDRIWPGAFVRMEQFIEDAGIKAEDTALGFNTVQEMFNKGEAAIIRGTGTQVVIYEERDEIDPVFLPYFGQNGEKWLLTYPAFQVALNRKLEDDEGRKEQAFRILNVMLSEEGQNILAQEKDVLPYSKNVRLELSGALANLRPYIEENRLYVRLASNDFFEASREVVHKMIQGEYDAQQAYTAFDAKLKEEKDRADDTVRSFAQGYVNEFYGEGGNPASSVMAGTLRQIYGSDILLAPSYCFTGSVFAADYTEQMLGNMVMPNALAAWRREMTGAELKEAVRVLIEGENDSLKPFNDYSLPTVSGISIEVEKCNGTFKLLRVQKDGKEIGDDGKYLVVWLDKACYLEKLADFLYPQEGLKAFGAEENRVRDTWVAYCMEDGRLEKPQEYIVLRD